MHIRGTLVECEHGGVLSPMLGEPIEVCTSYITVCFFLLMRHPFKESMCVIMNKKKFALGLCILLMLPLAAACGKKTEAQNTTPVKQTTDWRNQIEYDGSFYVSREIKLLYSLDKGTITLWDDGGTGEKLQTLTYDTAVSDAMENLIREDINGDGYADLQTIYSENQGEACYNLWLWDAESGKYVPCAAYRLVKNPIPDLDSGTISSVLETEGFGTVRSTYQFTETLTLELSSQIVEGADDIAMQIARTFTGAAAASLSDGEAEINGEACTVYTVGTGVSGSGAYIAYTPDAAWYADINCLGLYRAVDWNGSAYTLGHYMEDAGEAQDLARAVYTAGDVTIDITATEEGFFGGRSAVQYTMEAEGNFLCKLCKPDLGGWYVTVDGAAYYAMSDGEVGEVSEYVFS